MRRKDFLRGIGLAGAASFIPFKNVLAGGAATEDKPTACVLIPTETAGPFPLDLTENTAYFRSNIIEDRTGVPFKLRLKIIGDDNCEPMQNVRVNIWHCDKDGSYSGYTTSAGNTTNTVGQTWLRGYQMTDANGEVEFTTIFPGWYQGRICHIHFQVWVSANYAAISQLSFDITAKNAIYQQYASLYTNGNDPMTFQSDNIFSDGYQYQLATLTEATEGYESYLEVTVKGSGTTAIGNIDKQNAGQFTLGQNYPNPYAGATTIPFTLKNASEVMFAIIDMMGRTVATLHPGNLLAGDHSVVFDTRQLGLAQGNYVYQIRVSNKDGVFRQAKVMTAAR